ncbi:MAG: UDP-N-acetylmuramoyl-L-alanyl-D-glutamate--2,6-diaminopimelate ligase, partial [Clostridia bacterium]|nr:UDP-N-acetylmuramoyl-L-alanyl-D-glutamate--2,6-diaminopimelate ligase [Clostridia bacterium]
MRLSELAQELTGASITGDANITGLCTDSRVAGEGDLFFCFGGTHVDSHAFAYEAEERGCAAIVCERDIPVSVPKLIVKDGREAMARLCAAFYGHPEKKLKIVGVTGTNGKTTVTHMFYNILLEAGKK